MRYKSVSKLYEEAPFMFEYARERSSSSAHSRVRGEKVISPSSVSFKEAGSVRHVQAGNFFGHTLYDSGKISQKIRKRIKLK